jgi:PhnB protein
MKAAHPYLHFNGNCEAAFEFYRSVFGTVFSLLSRFKDAPVNNHFLKDEEEKILHISLPLGSSAMLMGSDVPSAFPQVIAGTNFFVSLHTDTQEEAERVFKALSVDGQVTMPIEKTFWGSYFGMLSDQFGVQWMVSYDYQQAYI